MVDDAIVFDVCIEASDHNLETAAVRSLGSSQSGKIPEAQSKLTQPFLQGQLGFRLRNSRGVGLLDTPDHFDYDSACTMILNLTQARVMRRGSAEALRLSF